MVGGVVIETIVLSEEGKIWVNCKSRTYDQTCAIYVEDCDRARTISEGDSLWWQGPDAMWTPKNQHGETIGPVDVEIPRIGLSGVSRPSAN